MSLCPYCSGSYDKKDNPDGYCGRVMCHMKHQQQAKQLQKEFHGSWFYLYGTFQCPDQSIKVHPWKFTYKQMQQIAEWAQENQNRPDKKGKRDV